MSDLLNLIEKIKQLSAESQANLADYVEFLQWQEQQRTTSAGKGWSFSFIESFKEAAVHATDQPGGMDVKLGPAVVGGESRPALWAHPPVVGQAVIEYFVPIPQNISDIKLRLAIGIRDGAQISDNNWVAFNVKVNGLRVWGEQSNAQIWHDIELPLDLIPGDMARLALTTEALNHHEWTWAVWGNPELVGNLVRSG